MRLQEAMISLYKSQLFHSLRPQLTPIHLPDSSLLLIICNRVSNFYHFIIWYHSQPQPVINDIALHINPPWRCTVRVAVQALSGLGSVFTDQVFQKTIGLGYSWGAEPVVWFIMSSAFAVIISIGQWNHVTIFFDHPPSAALHCSMTQCTCLNITFQIESLQLSVLTSVWKLVSTKKKKTTDNVVWVSMGNWRNRSWDRLVRLKIGINRLWTVIWIVSTDVWSDQNSAMSKSLWRMRHKQSGWYAIWEMDHCGSFDWGSGYFITVCRCLSVNVAMTTV